MGGLLLDTHVWLWFAEKNPLISPKIGNLIEETADHSLLFLSPISVWELAMLTAHGKVSLSLPCIDWVEESLQAMNMQVLPLDIKTAVDSCYLPQPFHGDPADQMIVASARIHQLSLVTKDRKIQDYAENQSITVLAL